MKRGEIYFVDFGTAIGSEQGGLRPAVIIQNDIGNKYSPTTIVAPITSRHNKKKIPTHYWLDKMSGLTRDSQVLCEQVRTVNKDRVKKYVGNVSITDQEGIDKALKISLGLD